MGPLSVGDVFSDTISDICPGQCDQGIYLERPCASAGKTGPRTCFPYTSTSQTRHVTIRLERQSVRSWHVCDMQRFSKLVCNTPQSGRETLPLK